MQRYGKMDQRLRVRGERKQNKLTYDIQDSILHLHHHAPAHIPEDKFHNVFLMHFQHPDANIHDTSAHKKKSNYF